MPQGEYLPEKLANLDRMQSLAEAQVHALTDGSDLDLFFDLLKQREHLRSRIMADDRRIERRRKNARDTGAPDKTAAELRERIEQVVLNTLKLDQRIEELIGRRREKLLADIRELRQGHKALKRYGTKTSTARRHVDKRG